MVTKLQRARAERITAFLFGSFKNSEILQRQVIAFWASFEASICIWFLRIPSMGVQIFDNLVGQQKK